MKPKDAGLTPDDDVTRGAIVMFKRWLVDTLYLYEHQAGRLWDRIARDGITAGWYDNVPAFIYRLRKRAERLN